MAGSRGSPATRLESPYFKLEIRIQLLRLGYICSAPYHLYHHTKVR